METDADKGGAVRPRVAYYCMEYGLDPSMRTYSGGLGILAGDYLKGARDAGYPVIGIGIRWLQGYGEQTLDARGDLDHVFQDYHYDFLQDTGKRVSVRIRGCDVACRIWECRAFGNAPLYLLDAHLPENGRYATITDKLYTGDGLRRVAQETILGVGGLKAIEALGLDVDVHHFNEGHAVFAGLELLRRAMRAGRPFEDALREVRRRIVFTTHTPVEAGNEEHALRRLRVMGVLDGFTDAQAAAIGGNPFNMTAAALRLSRKANAVADLHGEVAESMWAHLDAAAPICAITNAIHVPTWVDARMLDGVHAENGLWDAHQANKRELIAFIRERTGAALDENVLLVAFSRRGAPYKRWDLIFGDDAFIAPLLEQRRVQLVFSGKSHPSDGKGRAMIARIIEKAREFPESVVFLPNYDMTIGRTLTRGADVWLNCPRRPNEASGTSGMKAAMNGVLNLSTLDGWWPEACEHGVNGWQYGDGEVLESADEQDAHDRKALYRVLVDQVLPAYYDRRADWVAMMRRSILSTRDRFGMPRMLNDYYRLLYAP